MERVTQLTAEEIFHRGSTNAQCDMHGHMQYLRSVAKGNVLEIGLCQCFSTSALLLGVREHGGHVTSMDIEHCENEIPTLDRPQPNWSFIQADSTLYSWTGGPLDVLLIDGGHSYSNVKADMEIYIPLVNLGGLVLLHDVLVPRYPGVAKAFSEWTGEKEIRHESYGLGIIHV